MSETTHLKDSFQNYIQRGNFDMESWKRDEMLKIYKGDERNRMVEIEKILETIASEALVRRAHNVDILFLSDKISKKCNDAKVELEDAIQTFNNMIAAKDQEIASKDADIAYKDSYINSKELEIEMLKDTKEKMQKSIDALSELAKLAERLQAATSHTSPSLPSPPSSS